MLLYSEEAFVAPEGVNYFCHFPGAHEGFFTVNTYQWRLAKS